MTGPENALAWASAAALARGEASAISPLVVHGPSGVGKSRLLAGLVAERLTRQPGAAVAHLEAEAFATLCHEAAAAPEGWSTLRARFRCLDLFVLENLQALERASMALAELAHTLDALADAGAAAALSARTGPGHWTGWPRRLVSRLLGGLVVPMDRPSPASLRRHVLERARATGVRLSAGAVDALAEAADGYRTVDGWLSRLRLAVPSSQQPISQTLAAQLLGDDAPIAAPTIDQVARAVSARLGIKLSELRSASRQQAVVQPRHLAMHLARVVTGESFRAIGAYFGHRDAATVRHACAVTIQRLAADPALAAAAMVIQQSWQSPRPDPPA